MNPPPLSDASTRPRSELSEAPARKPHDNTVEQLAYRLDQVARSLGVSRSAIERERRAGRFPKPDRVVGRMPLWRPETILEWLGGGTR
jgi:predicted DNA-binding transcriptional regulator AlpA